MTTLALILIGCFLVSIITALAFGAFVRRHGAE